MTPADWIAAGAAVFTGVCTLGGAVYMRGKLDAHSTAATDAIKALGTKIDNIEKARESDAEARGAQEVRNANFETLATDARQARDLSVKVESRQNEHEKGCDRRQAEIERRLEKMDGNIEHLAAEVRNLALGLADQTLELPPNIGRRSAR